MRAILELQRIQLRATPRRERATWVELAAKKIADQGHADEALEALDDILKEFGAIDPRGPHPKFRLGGWLECAAEIAFKHDRVAAGLRYAERLRALDGAARQHTSDHYASRANQVCAWHGVADPQELSDAYVRQLAGFYRSLRRARESFAAGDTASAVRHGRQASSALADSPDWRLARDTEALAKLWIEHDQPLELAELLRKDAVQAPDQRLRGSRLHKLGLADAAADRYEQEAQEIWDKVQRYGTADLNPTKTLAPAVIGLWVLGRASRAEFWLNTMLDSDIMFVTSPLRPGFIATGVLSDIAQSVARVRGPQAGADYYESFRRKHAPWRWRVESLKQRTRYLWAGVPYDLGHQLANPDVAERRLAAQRANLIAEQEQWDTIHHILNRMRSPERASDFIWFMTSAWEQAD